MTENILDIARRVRAAHEGTTCDCDDVQLAEAVERMVAALRDAAMADQYGSLVALTALHELGIPLTEEGDE